MRLSHVAWNFGGLAVPLVVALLAIPETLGNLGPDRFGYLALAWALIGYSTALDLGVGRATTQKIATLRAGEAKREREICLVLGTAIRMSWATGFFFFFLASGLIAFLTMGRHVSASIPPSELCLAGVIVAAALPFQVVSASYRGVNEAYLNFRSISLVRVVLGVANFGIPCLLSLFSTKLYWLALSLVGARLISLWAYKYYAGICVGKKYPILKSFDKKIAKDLFGFGGWFTLSGVVNPIVSIADRFLIASLISISAVSVYFVSYELVAQSLILVGAITTVAFPHFSALKESSNTREMRSYYLKLMFVAVAIMLLVSIVIWVFGNFGLRLWLRTQFLPIHYDVARHLAIALPFYAAGTIGVSLMHAYGETRRTAILNVIELPFYLAIIFSFVKGFGVLGAAYAWIARVMINSILMTGMVLLKLKK